MAAGRAPAATGAAATASAPAVTATAAARTPRRVRCRVMGPPGSAPAPVGGRDDREPSPTATVRVQTASARRAGLVRPVGPASLSNGAPRPAPVRASSGSKGGDRVEGAGTGPAVSRGGTEHREHVGDGELAAGEPVTARRATRRAGPEPPWRRSGSTVPRRSSTRVQVGRAHVVPESGAHDVAQPGDRELRRRQREADVGVAELGPQPVARRRRRRSRGRRPAAAGPRPGTTPCPRAARDRRRPAPARGSRWPAPAPAGRARCGCASRPAPARPRRGRRPCRPGAR